MALKSAALNVENSSVALSRESISSRSSSNNNNNENEEKPKSLSVAKTKHPRSETKSLITE